MKERIRYAALAALALWLPAVAAIAQQNDEALYAGGLGSYQANAYDDAERLFQELRTRYPDSRRADDAAYYLGRLYARKDRVQEAESALRTAVATPDGNRRVEAAYELGRILSRRRDYQAAVQLLDPLKKSADLDHEDENLSLLLAKTHYNVGIIAKKEHRDDEARAEMESAVAVYQVVADKPVRERSAGEALAGLGKAHAKLLDLARAPEEQQKHRDAAVDALTRALASADEKDAGELRALLDQVRGRRKPKLGARLLATSGSDALVMTPGFRAALEGSLDLPLADAHRLEIDAAFEHDDFTPKTFNFVGSETGMQTEVVYQRTDQLSGRIAWRAGDRQRLLSHLALSADALFAESDTDNSWGLELSEEVGLWLAPGWRAVLGASGALSKYPNYPADPLGSHELDSVLLHAAPELQWIPVAPLRVGLQYSYELKQYLDAKYGVAADENSTATGNKQYQTHTAELALKAKLGEWRPSLAYTFTFNKTYNYDVWVSTPGPNRFVEDYFDYIEHGFAAGLVFQTDRLRIEGDAGIAFRNFSNYPARDENRVFTGDLRQDVRVTAALKAGYVLWERGRNGFADASMFLEAAWEQADSNMLYEASFDASNSSATVFAGILLEL